MPTEIPNPSPPRQLRKFTAPPAPVIAPAAPRPFRVTEARWLPPSSQRMTLVEAGMLAAALGF